VIASGFTLLEAHPGFNDVEIWEFKNTSGGWFHPVHIHLIDFKILDRNGRPSFGYEKAPKDVIYLGENETVRMIGRFERQVGRYMMHCHNLVHEDHDMMVQFEVGTGGHDPITTDPARNGPWSAADVTVRRRPLCSPCHRRRCSMHEGVMQAIPPEEVLKAIDRRLGAGVDASIGVAV